MKSREYQKGYRKGYRRGYAAGYQDGVDYQKNRQYRNDMRRDIDIMMLPVDAMELSSRGRNCLVRAGCACVSDVVMLTEQALAAMRNLGPKTGGEIADWLKKHGVINKAWSKYL